MKRDALFMLGPLTLVAALFVLGACKEIPTADTKQEAATAALAEQANQQVRMPGVTNFTERKIVAKLYTLRDQSITTHTYVMDFQGRLWFVCDSLGYGLPYGVQFTNPERTETYGQGGITGVPQPEPNGLFMPPTAEGTWVICAAEKAGDFLPLYVEPRVVVSPFKLKSAGSWQE